MTRTYLKTFAIYQKQGAFSVEITWVSAFDEFDALAKSGVTVHDHFAKEM